MQDLHKKLGKLRLINLKKELRLRSNTDKNIHVHKMLLQRLR